MPPLARSVRIPRPCAESWAAMTPTPAGRHCAACQKVVVDFTQKTDAEILAYLAGAAGPACGRFRAGQLARPLWPAAPGGAAPRWRTWLAALVTAGGALGAGRVAAQTTGGYFSAGPIPAAQPATPLPPASAPVGAPSSGAGVVTNAAAAEVHGVVTDAATGDPLPGATIVLQGTELHVFTNAKGEFTFLPPAGMAAPALSVAYVGYITVRLPAGGAPMAIMLQTDIMGLSEVVVAGGYQVARPWPWHPRRLYYWTKYQLGRPFRH
ncbi:carboxypeptidase-like regulatory domain-containing protein [Hymenobacter psoromatis]|uniref:carboxypeptidase-like regulatory domain-containing protein n=1 Tax=Hymenobacter psoromatis TaxID=1484116 RepID=UPI001CBA7D02|nr:carboxypeptidase-like regulatory domain-containing protein [Hymenobacter psoromatis]